MKTICTVTGRLDNVRLLMERGSDVESSNKVSRVDRFHVCLLFYLSIYQILLSISLCVFCLFVYLTLFSVLLHKQCSQTISISNDYMLSKSMSICHTYCTTIKHLDRLYCIVFHMISFDVIQCETCHVIPI